MGGGPHLVRRHAHPSLGCASMRVFSGVRSLGDGYLALNPGDEIDVQYWGRTETGDENWLFCLKHSTGERGWCSAACLSVWARVAFSSLGGGYLGLSQGDEVRVAYVGSRKQGDDGWLYGTAYATGEEGWFESKCCWARLDLGCPDVRAVGSADVPQVTAEASPSASPPPSPQLIGERPHPVGTGPFPRYKLVDYLPEGAMPCFGPQTIGHHEVRWPQATAEIQTCFAQNLSLIALNDMLWGKGMQRCQNLSDAITAAVDFGILDHIQERWLRFCNQRGNKSKHEPGWTDPASSSPPPSPQRPHPPPTWMTPQRPPCRTLTRNLIIKSYGVKSLEVGNGSIVAFHARADMHVDARCFSDRRKGWLKFHDGRHPAIMERLAHHADFPRELRRVRDFMSERCNPGQDIELKLAIRCKSGHHRSVAFAELLIYLLARHTTDFHVFVEHATLHRPCNCSDCNWQNRDLPLKVAMAYEIAVDVWRGIDRAG